MATTVFELPTSDAIATARWQLMTDGTALWSGLVEGVWSVVAEFECDGCLYLVVRGNDPTARPTLALCEREQEVLGRLMLGQSNKLVSYELCMSQPCVSTCVKKACSKLGIRSRTLLLALMQFGLGPARSRAEPFFVAATERVVLRLERRDIATPAVLTSSERAIFAAIVRGLSNAQIAALRKRSLNTIANQVRSVFCKLAVSSRAELVARHGAFSSVFQQPRGL